MTPRSVSRARKAWRASSVFSEVNWYTGMCRCSAASRSGSGGVPGFSGAQNTPATVSPPAKNASRTAVPKSLCPTMAIRISIFLNQLPKVMISHISST
jgi:hypothetical protein